ncbi:MAG: glycosyltransferase family A protein [Deltaproteobacteria bacterium]|nr:glycosyltransferase family A protein [Deltaproteobacteria bacterium]
MKPLTVLVPFSREPLFDKNLNAFLASDLVEEVVVLCPESVQLSKDRCKSIAATDFFSSGTLRFILEACRTEYLLFLLPGIEEILLEADTLDQFCDTAGLTGAGVVYSDFYDLVGPGKIHHLLNDYQPGSVRDDFDFGPMVLFSVSAIRAALDKHGDIPKVEFAGLYDLRLKVSIDHPIYHIRKPLYAAKVPDGPPDVLKSFSYVDPRNEASQKEMETVFTDYLKKIDAYLSPHFKEAERVPYPFPVEASVVIPVRNRKETIAGAVKSALSQQTDFPFNVIVVDNHSTDGTTVVLGDLDRQYSALKHVIPERRDLGIGGCWNEALFSEACGRYVIQLDSDDLYSSNGSLQKIMDVFHRGSFAMVIGSYTLVNADLKEIPPGLIDHREWTDENGRNNALRINGLGAPRAFNTHIMRKIEFLNVSYGEDYAAELRICREYRIGRVYESLYWCRRWSGNTDASLRIEEVNRNDAFKDKVRTNEILARQKMNRGV